MNPKRILFSSLLTALAGAMMGVAIAEICGSPYISRHYQNLHLKFAVVGSVLGAVVGAGQESIRELHLSQAQAPATTSFLPRQKP